MGNTCTCLTSTNDLEFRSFYHKNTYKVTDKLDEGKIQIITDRIAPGYGEQYKHIASYIAHQPRLQFADPNFNQMEIYGSGEASSLEKMYNFTRRRLENVFKNSETPLDIFDQKEVELCYLCTVFYFICQHVELKEQIFITRRINPHYAYILRLFCNGHPCDVVVDETVPTLQRNIKYLSTRQPQEIWPFLLEKAWCKQIGGYDKARGLSPEDCFQQITGIPAYSFPFRQHSPRNCLQILTQAKSSGCWITFTAATSNASRGLRSRQVFYLERINQRTQDFLIRSPYIDFEFPNKQKPIQGAIQLSFEQLLGNFQYVTIGNYLEGYVPQSCSFRSAKDEEVIFEINVETRDNFNIRVLQFYQEYLNNAEKLLYQYSPVLMELYDQRCRLVQKCEGRLENIEGVRSSNLADFIFVKLNPGLYYLRVQVSWVNSELQNRAYVVSYAPKNTVSIRRFQGDNREMAARLVAITLQQEHSEQIINETQQVKVKHIEKTYGYVLGIQNISSQIINLKLIFKDSENITINHHQLIDNNLVIKLEGLQERILEILPKNPKKQYYLAPFDIVKL